VATVLEGSVRRADTTLRVTAQLIDVADGYHLWSETYEREVKDVFAIQEEIARAIVTALKMKLVNALTLPLIDPHTANVEAYTAYLKARYFWRRKSARGLKRCIEYFEQAIAADPAYALAHAGLADSFIALGYISYLRPREAFPRAKAAAERALTLDGSLAEAHTASACVSLLYDWDWPRAERGFQQALELNARYGVARFWYASYLAAAGRSEECLAEVSQAQALAPLSLMTSVNAAFALYFARRYDEAIAQGRQALDLEPTSFLAHCVLGLTYAQQSMPDRAVAALQEAVTFSGGHPLPAAGLGYAYALAGKKDDAERVLASLQQRSQQEYVPAFGFVMVYAGLGDSDEALAWLARACEERSHWLAYVNVWPLLDDLRRDARFTTVLEQVGLR
jgi:Tfp pilus assembly protein PilF